MTISENDVVQAYIHILGREPENSTVIQEYCDRSSNVWNLVETLIGSVEFRTRRCNNLDDHTYYPGYGVGEIDILLKYKGDSLSKDGYIVDFVGSAKDVTFDNATLHLGGVVEDIPVPGNIHAEAIEWIGCLKAVESATSKYHVAEIGAGWGPWLVSTAYAARSKGIDEIYMVGVEGDAGHVEFLKRHLVDNGFDPSDHRILHGIAGAADGSAFFPSIDSQEDWGAAAIFSETDNMEADIDYRGHHFSYNKLPCFSMETILSDKDLFDLCHIDVQGTETDLIASSRAILLGKVRFLVIGTHSRKIEGELIELLSSDGWVLENEKPCRFNLNVDGGKIAEKNTSIDGTQVWRNSRLSRT